LQADRYVSALLCGVSKAKGWAIAEQVGDRSPDRTQRLLNRAVWNTAAVASRVRRFAVAGLDAAARRSRRRASLRVGALDETGQQKQGTATAGVKRQYLGCAGRVANGINTVHLSYVRERVGHALIGARLWIPAEQIGDQQAAHRMGLPDDLTFRTKGQVAVDLLRDAVADGVAFDVICGDEVYGSCTELREHLRQQDQAYVLRVASTFMITLPSGDGLTCAQAVALLAKRGPAVAGPLLRHRLQGRAGTRGRCSPPPPHTSSSWCAGT
jgi:SRSO17 transposase